MTTIQKTFLFSKNSSKREKKNHFFARVNFRSPSTLILINHYIFQQASIFDSTLAKASNFFRNRHNSLFLFNRVNINDLTLTNALPISLMEEKEEKHTL